jgi:hypothetical protein
VCEGAQMCCIFHLVSSQHSYLLKKMEVNANLGQMYLKRIQDLSQRLEDGNERQGWGKDAWKVFSSLLQMGIATAQTDDEFKGYLEVVASTTRAPMKTREVCCFLFMLFFNSIHVAGARRMLKEVWCNSCQTKKNRMGYEVFETRYFPRRG